MWCHVSWLAAVLLVTALAAPALFCDTSPAPERPGWELVWSDEFDYEGLPDPERWSFETGFVRNYEEQCYTRARLENVRVEDGRLIIEGRRERWPNQRYEPESRDWRREREYAEYTSGSVETRGLFSFQYGRVEVRAKLPEGRGVWPAIWTLGENYPEVGWPRCGEIDIMEFVGHDPNRVHANVHFLRDDEHASQAGYLVVEAPYRDFHVYAMEWDERHIAFFFDDQEYHRVDLDIAGEGADNPFRRPHYLKLNLALGGTWGGEIDDTIFPQQFVIDYVRVYQRGG